MEMPCESPLSILYSGTKQGWGCSSSLLWRNDLGKEWINQGIPSVNYTL